MFKTLLLQFLRSRTVQAGCVLILLAGLAGIYTGKQFLAKQQKLVEDVTRYQQEHIQRNTRYNKDDIGLLMYYLRFSLINQTSPVAGLSIGQRDLNSSLQFLTIRGLQAQQYDTDLLNPFQLSSGNLDLGFVFLYLFPLLIIAFTYNLLSGEEEGGTWKLVQLHSGSPLNYLVIKLLVRILVTTLVFALLIVLATLILPLRWNNQLFAFTATSYCYLLFWFALGWLAAGFRKSSAVNALSLLTSWIVLILVLPSALNNYIVSKYPAPEAFQTMIKQRDGYHKKWDVDKQVTMNRFYELYPEMKKYPLPDKNFSWLWYYAMWHLGDDESRKDVQLLRTKIRLREKEAQNLAFFLPTLHTQLRFNEIAETSLSNHLQFLDSTERFHETLRLQFYPKIFENTKVDSVNWQAYQPRYFHEPFDKGYWWHTGPLLAAIAFVLLFSSFYYKKINHAV